VLPLLLEHGSALTTRQIAEAAGIAEGTVFRVFADKRELVDAVVDQVFDPTSVTASLLTIDRRLPLEDRLARAVEVLQHRVATIWALMTAVGISRPPDRHRLAKRLDAPDMQALAELLAPDAERLRRSPAEAALLLRSFTFACSHPAMVADEPMTPPEIVDLFLDGIRTPRPAPGRGGAPCS
jgi:AcrR family transcriptional regulator